MAPDPPERRHMPRHAFATDGSNPVVVTLGVVPRAAFVCDLSATGLAVLTIDPPPMGSIVPLWLATTPGAPSRLMLVRVIHIQVVSEDLHRLGLACLDESSQVIFEELLHHMK